MSKDMEAHDVAMGGKAAARVSYKVAQGVRNDLVELEERMRGILQQLGLQVRAAAQPPSMVQKMDELHDKFFDWLRAAKMKNRAMVLDTENKGKTRDANLERVLLLKFDGKPEGWTDFSRTFKAILRTCDPAIEMVRLRTALPASAIQYILGMTDPTEAWRLLNKQFGDRQLSLRSLDC